MRASLLRCSHFLWRDRKSLQGCEICFFALASDGGSFSQRRIETVLPDARYFSPLLPCGECAESTLRMVESLIIGGFPRFSTCKARAGKLQFPFANWSFDSKMHEPLWRNWQTRWTQNPVLVTECRFDPDRRHRSTYFRSNQWSWFPFSSCELEIEGNWFADRWFFIAPSNLALSGRGLELQLVLAVVAPLDLLNISLITLCSSCGSATCESAPVRVDTELKGTLPVEAAMNQSNTKDSAASI